MQSILSTAITAIFGVSRAIKKIKWGWTWRIVVNKIVAIKQKVDAMDAVNSIKECDTKMMTIIKKIKKMSDAEAYKNALIKEEITSVIKTGMRTINGTMTETSTEIKVDTRSNTILDLMDMHALSIGAIMSAANTNKDALRNAIVSDKKGGLNLILAIFAIVSIAKTDMSSDELTKLCDVIRSLQDLLYKNYKTLDTIMNEVITASASYSYSITYGNKEPESAFLNAMYDKILRKAKLFIDTSPYHDFSTMMAIRGLDERCQCIGISFSTIGISFSTIADQITKICEFTAIIAFVIAEDRQILESLNMTECNECDTCPICFNNFDDNKGKIKTSCNHQFHESCLETWKVYSKTNTFSCPLCRTTQKK